MQKRLVRIRSAAIAALIALFMLPSAVMPVLAAESPDPLTLAIVPRLPPATLHREWSPFVERLQREAGVKIELKVFSAFAEFEQFVFAGRADLVFINPYQAVELRKAMGYIPLVRDGARKLSGVLVVRADGPIRKLSDLEGQDIAFPHPNAFGASLHMRATLREVANINFNPVYVNTHANVYRHVLLGKVAAGGGVNVTLNKEPEHLRSQLRVVYQTEGVAPHPLAAHPRVPEDVRDRIVRSIIGMGQEIQGRALLQSTTLTQPVRADFAKDYAGLEKLRLDKYYVHSDAPEQ
jgi:phosphonate transport system substrate-binding protein